MKNSTSIVLLIAGLFLSGLSPSVFAEDAISSSKTEPSEKVYVIYTRGASEAMGGGVVVSHLTSGKFLGVQCLEGKGVVSYMKDVTVKIPTDSIVMIMEFDSMDAWKKSTRNYDQPDEK